MRSLTTCLPTVSPDRYGHKYISDSGANRRPNSFREGARKQKVLHERADKDDHKRCEATTPGHHQRSTSTIIRCAMHLGDHFRKASRNGSADRTSYGTRYSASSLTTDSTSRSAPSSSGDRSLGRAMRAFFDDATTTITATVMVTRFPLGAPVAAWAALDQNTGPALRFIVACGFFCQRRVEHSRFDVCFFRAFATVLVAGPFIAAFFLRVACRATRNVWGCCRRRMSSHLEGRLRIGLPPVCIEPSKPHAHRVPS
jgi:hypothetical protein